jgi:two-component system, LuxR family, response regulator DctR
MQPTQDALVFIVDDDAGVREALAWLLRSRRLPSESFESADEFVAFLNHNNASTCCWTCACPA